MSNVNGVIVINKDAGMTSHDCVMRVRRLLGQKKSGHTGTLDPDVTGVLPICLGQGTRIVEYLQELPKAYEVTMRIGSTTTTEDASGEVIEEQKIAEGSITREQLEEVFARFLGEIEQVPPMYSAVKVNGKRLYDLAREGIVIERQARKVKIYDFVFHGFQHADDGYDVSFLCRCSKGTYIRTLCVDMGAALGYPAHMARLIRVESGPFRLEQAVTIEQLEAAVEAGTSADLIIPVADALSFLPSYEVAPARKKAVLNGLETALPGCKESEGSLIRLLSEGQLLGLHRIAANSRGLVAKPEKVFQGEV
ncbi:tRNA pseudouridine(55) synthase TruB [Brevibacillus fluminis]|uniref:tRNA pseudouridine synthase B n=1 Tax=Brevibacillus fluminis TaxID=511487 RepID=A0A3M8DUT4_9BACL|nr:tRNA pseudouridine(55) synthase TruB [Brevibacillus fluminis]RNB91832.1 tRNA pseudouridine(55) synthase TruB [Brevibacillus fluminis]